MEREKFETRALENALKKTEATKLRGKIPYNSLSGNLGGFVEQIAPGAFKKTIQENRDLKLLVNHQSTMLIGRTKNDTLRVWEEEDGLAFEAIPPETQLGKDTMTLVENGYVDQISFGFRCIKDSWEESPGNFPLRTLKECELKEISIVTFPAYPSATVAVRSLLDRMPEEERQEVISPYVIKVDVEIPEPVEEVREEPEVTEPVVNHSEPEPPSHSFDETAAKQRQRELQLLEAQMKLGGQFK